MKFVAALALALIFSACSSGSNDPYGNGANAANPNGPNSPKNPANGPQTPNQAEDKVGSAQPGSLTRHAWCINGEQQGQAYQVRLNFINAEDFDTHVYMVKQGRRDSEVQGAGQHGTYAVSGSNITVTVDGKAETYPLRLDPQDATTGAEKLHIGDAAYDPCN